MSQSPVVGETQSGVVTRFEHWIDGRPQPPATHAYLDSVGPADGARVAEIARGNAEDVELAAAAALFAQPDLGAVHRSSEGG